MGIVDDGGCERERGLALLTMPKLIVGKHRRSIWAWLGIVCVVVEGLDSVSLNSGNSFLPGDSSSVAWIPAKISGGQ